MTATPKLPPRAKIEEWKKMTPGDRAEARAEWTLRNIPRSQKEHIIPDVMRPAGWPGWGNMTWVQRLKVAQLPHEDIEEERAKAEEAEEAASPASSPASSPPSSADEEESEAHRRAREVVEAEYREMGWGQGGLSPGRDRRRATGGGRKRRRTRKHKRKHKSKRIISKKRKSKRKKSNKRKSNKRKSKRMRSKRR